MDVVSWEDQFAFTSFYILARPAVALAVIGVLAALGLLAACGRRFRRGHDNSMTFSF